MSVTESQSPSGTLQRNADHEPCAFYERMRTRRASGGS